MLIRTHLAGFIFVSLFFIEKISDPYVFLVAGLVSTFLPDLDSHTSKIGRHEFSRIITAFTKHRGFLHSLFFVLVVYLLLEIYFPVASFGFLMGYGLHLIFDCFTKRGIRLFYPLKFKVRGFIKSGGRIDSFLFLAFSIGVVFALFFEFFSSF
jgi:inner membrane protein